MRSIDPQARVPQPVDNPRRRLGAEIRGNPVGMDSTHGKEQSAPADRLWQEAVALVEADLHQDAVAEAYEVYCAEVARSRLTDRVGEVQATLLGGADLRGRLLEDDPVADCLHLRSHGGTRWLIPVAAIITLRGGGSGLRPDEEAEPSRLTAVLRREEGRVLDLHLRDGQRWQALLVAVGADHVVLQRGADVDRVVVPLSAVEAWGLR